MTPTPSTKLQPFASREIRFQGLREPGGWTLKLYSVVYGRGSVEWAEFEPALRLAERELPAPDEACGRPGLGFLIAHQGRTGDYVVLGWWDNENELPLRVWVRRTRGERWRPASGGESICVWDLEIIWAEREAWVETMLAATGSSRAGYLARVEDRHRAAPPFTRDRSDR